ncbi:MAG: pyridoxal phosphate-dependent aminotransferase [bacterium]
MKFAERMSRLGTETAFEVLAQVNALKAEGRDIVSFSIGEPDFATPENIREAGKKAIEDEFTHYTPSAGIMEFREVIAEEINRTRGTDYTAANVVVTPGGKPTIFFSMLALAEPGDEVIYPNPGFPIYESMIDFVGAAAVPLPLEEEYAFSFDVGKLEERVSKKTQFLILNSPQNPTGGVVPRESLERVAELARKFDFWVLSDEIYSRLVYDGEFQSITQFDGMKDRTIILDGHSKTWAMTGWRLGFGVYPAGLAEGIARLMTNSNSCTAAFTQVAGIEAITGDQSGADMMRDTFLKRRDIIVDGLNEIEGISCLNPAGAFYVWPNVTGACGNLGLPHSKALQEYLLFEAGVAVLGRQCFGRRAEGEEQEYVRFSYAASTEEIQEGLRRIEEVITDADRAQKFWAGREA